MDMSPCKSWFLGPKAENQEFFERMLLEAFRDYCYWRRNFHPEDQAYVRAAERLDPAFLQAQETLHDQLFELISRLKLSMPFFSPRYLGHMAKDLLTPGVLGYLAAMFYNQNNITREAAPITSGFESEALQALAAMLGYDPQQAWGHLCSGGTLANIEALWVARNLRLLPYQLRLAQTQAQFQDRAILDALLAEAQQQAQTPQRLLELQAQGLAGIRPELQELLNACSVSHLGLAGFERACKRVGISLPRLRIAYSQNAHYSLRKALGLLGLGEDAALLVPLDAQLRMDIPALEAALDALPGEQLLLAIVGVYGSTEEGAIDDFAALAALRDQTGCWLHADACYGGYALSLRARQPEADPAGSLQNFLQAIAGQQADLCWDLERCQRWLKVSEALSLADSIALDPHKLGYLPYPAGTVLYRDYRSRDLISCQAPYLNAEAAVEDNYWKTPYSGHFTLEGSRPGAAAAALWLAQRSVPLERTGHGRLVAGTLASAAYLQQVLSATLPKILPGISCRFLCPEPDLNLLCYTFSGSWQGRRLSLTEANHLVTTLYQLLLARQERPGQTQDFIVSMTRLETPLYSQERLGKIWQELSEGAPSEIHQGIALLRTVVMDPFLNEASTHLGEQQISVAESFALMLSQQLKGILDQGLGQL